MKWEPAAAMVLVVGLGAWLVFGPPRVGDVKLREGARLIEWGAADVRGVLEVVDPPGDEPPTFRFISRDGQAGEVQTREQMARVYGPDACDRWAARPGNWVFKLLKITSWRNVAWVLLGLSGQVLFSARMLLQWIASERHGKNVITVSFWWISLIAGLILFAYFAWRQDIVGVLGQSTGVVVYARNVRLHYKNLRRAGRKAGVDPADDPDPAAVPMVGGPRERGRG